MSVDIAMQEVAGAAASGSKSGTDSVKKTPDYVQRDQWPSFESWEFTVIFKENLFGEDLKKCQRFLGLVEKTGLIAELFKSPSNDKRILMKLRATQAWYDEKATKLNYLYELKPIKCEIPTDERTQLIVEQKLSREKIETPTIDKMYEPFDIDDKDIFMFNGYHNMYTSFRGSMIEYFLREREMEGGCDLSKFMKDGIIDNYYANHEPDRVSWFQSNWVLSMPWHKVPIDEVRNYFGEKIAFYFAWLSHFTAWLIAPGILGMCLAFYLVSRRVEEVNRSLIGPIFGILLMIYMTVYLEHWKRRSATLAFRWGVSDYDKREPDRPEYVATVSDFNFFTQETTMYYPKEKRLMKQLLGIPAVLFMIAGACTVIVIILMWKYVQFWLGPSQQKDPYAPWKIAVPSICNTVAIIIFSKSHRFIATALNDWENYQTQSEYESQLIKKVFFFEFVNNFTGTLCACCYLLSVAHLILGLLYTAFALGNMYQLYFAILIQMVIMQVVGNIQAIVGPQVEKHMNLRKVRSGSKLTWSDVLVGNDAYDTFGDFNEIVIQFGYVMFFSAAFPAAAVLSWFNNVIEIRLDAHSVLNCEPRPSAERKGGIGVWFEIIELMSFAAIVINGLIFCLTSDAIGAAIHNTCQFAFQHVDVTTNPQNMMTSLSWSEQGCVNFCSGMYQSQKFHNPSIYLGPCGTRHLINPVSKQPYSSCKTIPSPNDVECTAALPCPGPEGPDGQLSLTNNCDSPFLCNPVPLRVPVRSAKSLVGKQGVEDWSRAYCQESPRINLGSGQWRFETATQIYAWNPFLNNFASSGNISDFPAYTSVKTYEYGMIACTLLCAPGVECPYSQKQPKFNPQLQREESFKPMDYISPSLLNQIQLSASVKCVKDDKLVYGPPGDNKYCFLCPSEDLELTVPVIGLDNFNEIVFTTAFGPSVAALWSVLIFEHVVFFIKFLVMALVRLLLFHCILLSTCLLWLH
jgi:hypothetical protein